MNQKITPQSTAHILRLYAQGVGNQRIAAELHISTVTVFRVLKSHGVQLKARGKRGERCVEECCGKPTGGAERCAMHRRLRNAELNKAYKQGSAIDARVKQLKIDEKSAARKPALDIGDETWTYGMAHFIAKMAWLGE